MSTAFGRWLVELGALPDDAALADVLARQSERLPVASVAYVLGYASERTLAGVLAAATGRAAIVLDESVIDVSLLAAAPADVWRRGQVIPVCREGGVLHVAAARPEEVDGALLDAIARGAPVVVGVALAVTVARAIRGALAAAARGDAAWAGPEAAIEEVARRPRVALVGAEDEDASSDRTADRGEDAARAAAAVLDAVTREIDVEALIGSAPEDAVELDADDLGLDELASEAAFLAPRAGWPTGGAWAGDTSVPGGSMPGASSLGPPAGVIGDEASSDTGGHAAFPDADDDTDVAALVRTLADGPGADHSDLGSVLVVDDDYATRHLLRKELEPRGYHVATAASGDDAVAALRELAPALVIADILLPGVDGFRLCRAVKRTPRLRDTGVILMSAVIESGRVTPEVLVRYHADGYAAKPLDTTRLLRIVRELLGRRRAAAVLAADDASLRRALDAYQRGDLDGAIDVLRVRADAAPGSSRIRFALANMLQRARRLPDAIAEYEAVLDATPDFFPALTRLAYLYYRRGSTALAIETWRRSLPYCADRELRRNIELFVRSLAA